MFEISKVDEDKISIVLNDGWNCFKPEGKEKKVILDTKDAEFETKLRRVLSTSQEAIIRTEIDLKIENRIIIIKDGKGVIK